MTYCPECGHKLGFFEHATDGICNGCRQRLAREQAEKSLYASIGALHGRQTPHGYRQRCDYEKGRDCTLCHTGDAQGDKDGQSRVQWRSWGGQHPIPGLKIGGYPIRYRVGQSRGHVVKHDELRETSRGGLIITSQRAFLNPVAGHKPLSVCLIDAVVYVLGVVAAVRKRAVLTTRTNDFPSHPFLHPL